MRIAVLGATGRTGRHVVRQGLERGHRMVALAREPCAVTDRHERLETVRADVLGEDGLGAALAGAEAVVSALGVGSSRAPTSLYSQGIAHALRAMGASGTRRLAVISAAPAGPRDRQPRLDRHVVMPILDRLFGATYDDMRRMEAILQASDVDWVSLRAPRLVDGAAAGRYTIDTDGPGGRSITRADLAAALLDALDREDLYRRAAFVSS